MPRLAALHQEALALPPLNWDACLGMAGSILITGGLGDIGRLAGHWVASTSAASHVWLLGRSGRAAHTMAGALARRAGCVSMAAVDVAARADVAGLLALMLAHHAPAVSGLLHAGAVLQDGLLHQQTAASLRAVLAPKVAGALRLLGPAAAMPLHGTVLFSSLTALLGTPGQSNYAAANAAMDCAAQEW